MVFKSFAIAGLAAAGAAAQKQTPPRGWNSFDAFTKNVNETEFLANCEAVAKYLLPSGYDTCTIDYLWYEPDNGDWFLDDYCRPVPDEARFPSSAGGKGLKPIADKVHAMGMKFGINILRGTSIYAKQKNCKVKGTDIHLASIVSSDVEAACPWKKQSLSVDVSKPGGQEFFDSLYEQYAVDWGVDFIKNDCVFGGDLNPTTLAQIRAQSKSMQKFASVRNITYSLSPGGGKNVNVSAREVAKYANMYRVTMLDETWDHWSMLESHFVAASSVAAAGLIGAEGPTGSKSFPDLDVLPLGFITKPGDSHKVPNHMANLTKDEQTQLMTLWALARSPLFFGGDARALGRAESHVALELLTNKDMLDINAHSFNNHEVMDGFYPVDCPFVPNVKCGRMWTAELPGAVYVAAFFNSDGDDPYVSMGNVNKVFGVTEGEDCQVLDVWSGKKLHPTVNSSLTADVPAHGARLFKLSECKAPVIVV